MWGRANLAGKTKKVCDVVIIVPFPLVVGGEGALAFCLRSVP